MVLSIQCLKSKQNKKTNKQKQAFREIVFSDCRHIQKVVLGHTKKNLILYNKYFSHEINFFIAGINFINSNVGTLIMSQFIILPKPYKCCL